MNDGLLETGSIAANKLPFFIRALQYVVVVVVAV
jgi:hypothetical protein